MIALRCDRVQVADADTIKVRLEEPLVIDSKAKEAWPKSNHGNTGKDRYEAREQVWVRFVDLDAHESYTEAGKDETRDFEDWLAEAEKKWDEDQYELELYSPGDGTFEVDEYGRVLAGLARMCDGDKWETSLPTVHGNAVMWRDQTPL